MKYVGVASVNALYVCICLFVCGPTGGSYRSNYIAVVVYILSAW